MASLAFEEVIKENFDIFDTYTRKSLLALNEADERKVLDSLTSKLYQSIVDKVDDIDFGGIELSKGDITQIPNYEQMLECINIIKSILIEYHQDTRHPDTILTAISNIRERKDLFTKAFNVRMDLPMLLYNTVCLSIVSSISLIIATSIEYIKDSGDQGYDIKFDKVAYHRSSQNLLFENLNKFNKSCSNGELDKSMEHVLSQGTRQFLGMTGIGITMGIGAIALTLSIVPLMRELIYFFYHSRQSVSDYFEIQADLIQMNSEYLKQNNEFGRPEKEKKEIIRKQDKFVQRFRKIGNALAIDHVKANAAAKKDAAKSKKKYKLDDVVDGKLDSVPDEIAKQSSSLF